MISSVLYTQTGCADSADLRAWLQQHGIYFVERNVTDDPSAMAELAHQQVFATPLLVVGDQQFFGFQPAALAAILARLTGDTTRESARHAASRYGSSACTPSSEGRG